MAWVLAAFVPRLGVGGVGGLASLMVVIAALGILLAIAIPAYQDYRARAEVTAAMPEIERVRTALAPYVAEHRAFPADFEAVGLDAAPRVPAVAAIELQDDGVLFRFESTMPQVDGKTLLLQAFGADDGRIGWRCDGGTLEAQHRPASCRGDAVLAYDAASPAR
jgi:type IV pilus assembly protein PilA